MATTIVFGGTNDGQVASQSTSYPTARSGGTLSLDPANQTFLAYGQWLDVPSGFFTCYESFLEFAYTTDPLNLPVTGYLQFASVDNNGANARNMNIYGQNWGGGALTTADWVPAGTALTFYTAVVNVQNWPNGTKAKLGNNVMRALSQGSGPFRWLVASSREWLGNSPTGLEYSRFASSDAAGTASDPTLVFGTVRKNTLSYVHPGAKQLSTGDCVYLESDGVFPNPAILLKSRTTAGVVATIATVSVGSAGAASFDGAIPSQQKLCLVVDASDNLYVIGKNDDASTSSNVLTAKAYAKGAGLTWTPKTALSGSVPSYNASASTLNQGVGAWHPTSGGGHIMYLGAYVGGQGADTGQTFYVVLSATALLAGSGTLITTQGSDPTWVFNATSTDYINYPNESGSHLDVMADPSSVNRGYAISTDVDQFVNLGQYTLSAAGAVTTVAFPDRTVFAPHDPQGKARVLVLTDGRIVFSNGSDVRVFTSTQSYIGQGILDSAGVTNFPTQAALNASGAWDMVYDPASNRIWFYYLDTVDSRILRRTSYSLTSQSAVGDSVIVSSTVGAVATTNVGLRAPRGRLDERRVQLAVANVVTAGGALSTVYLDDTGLNVAPSPPLLATIAPFDATQSKVFGWTFQDSNPKDTQASYELQIIRTSDSVSMLATGTIASAVQQHTVPAATLANGVAYQWRVRNTDPAGNVGAFTAFQDFTTSGGGNVTITTPATDNPGNQNTSDYTVAWSASGTVQASYRIVAIKTSDGSTFSDTGFIASVATTDVVKNLQSNTEYRIQVTVRNAALAVSNPGTRLITPVYLSPEAPVVSLLAQDTYVRVTISNPTPVGDEPEVTVNRLFRRPVGSVPWTYLGDIAYNGVYRDYTAGANVAYEYYVRGEA